MSTRTDEVQKLYEQYRESLDGVCDFCDVRNLAENQIVESRDRFMVLQNRFPYSIWDNLPVSSHLMIVPSRHITHFTQFTVEEANVFFKIVTEYEDDGYSLYSRAPSNTSRTILHHHAHLIKLDTAS